jgi:dUTP pyrophosphatase
MRVLTDREICARLAATPPLVEGLIDQRTQVQSCGIDLTVRTVSRYTSAGAIDFDNSGRELSGTEVVHWNDGWLQLPQGPYHVIYAQCVNLPADVMALAYPRSSLLRCGVSLYTAVWDPGYSGRAEALLVVHNPSGFRLGRDARVAQLVFTVLGDAVDNPYNGRFKNENSAD